MSDQDLSIPVAPVAPVIPDNAIDKELASRLIVEAKKKAHESGDASGYERGKREAEERMATQQRGLTPAEVDQRIEESNRRLMQTQQQEMLKRDAEGRAQKILGHIAQSSIESRKKYEDYSEKVGTREFVELLQDTPQVLELLEDIDNAGDVLYHLANDNEDKVIALGINGKITSANRTAMKKLAASLKQNEAGKAMAAKLPPDPKERTKPSNVSGVDRELSRAEQIAALRKKFA